MQNLSVIVNGTTRYRAKLEQQLQELDRHQYHYSVLETTPEINAEALTKHALSSRCNLLIIAGGDGSVNEAVNGLMAFDQQVRSNTAMAILPLGSGNDFSRTIGRTHSLKEIIANHRNAIMTEVDVGQVSFTNIDGNQETRYFVNVFDVGIGAVIADIVNRRKKPFGSAIAYHAAIVEGLIKYKNSTMMVTTDEGEILNGRMMSMIVANGRYFGHGLGIAPEAHVNSGHFELVKLGNISLLDYLTHLKQLKRCEKLNNPEIEYLKGQSCHIETGKEKLPIEMDGEFVGYTPATVSISPSTIRFVTSTMNRGDIDKV